MNEAQALHDISGKLGRLEALQEANGRATNELTSNVTRLVEKLDKSDDIAREADQRSKSAHHRIDETNKRIDGINKVFFWVSTTIIGALIVGSIGLLYKFKGGS